MTGDPPRIGPQRDVAAGRRGLVGRDGRATFGDLCEREVRVEVGRFELRRRERPDVAAVSADERHAPAGARGEVRAGVGDRGGRLEGGQLRVQDVAHRQAVGIVDLDLGHLHIMARAGCGHHVGVYFEQFAVLAADPQAPIDALALAIAAEFREIDAAAAFARLDVLGEEVADMRDNLAGPDAGVETLHLVDSVADRWGVRGGSTRVWFEIDR